MVSHRSVFQHSTDCLMASIAAGTLAVAAPSAHATATEDFTITASDFSNVTGPTPAPFDPLSIEFTVAAFDPTQVYSNATSGLTVVSENPAFNGLISLFSNDPAAGGRIQASNGVQSFDFQWQPSSGNSYSFLNASYSVNGQDVDFSSTGSISNSPASVPEPATWALMIGGLGITGAALRRRPHPVVFETA